MNIRRSDGYSSVPERPKILMILRPIGPLKTLRREPFERSLRQGDCHGRWQFHSPYSARHAGQRTLLHGAASVVRADLDTQRSKAEGVLEWQQDMKKGETRSHH